MKLKRDSFTKMITYFKDGNARTWYSLDWKHRYSKTRDRNIGMKRHYDQLAKWGSLCGVAVIFDTSTGEKIAKFYEGVELSTTEEDG
jgi:hypothetical protein